MKKIFYLILVISFTLQLAFAQKSIKSTDKIQDLKPLEIINQIDSPCPVGAPSNPNPPNGATGVSVFNPTLLWINGTGTIKVEIWFGLQGSIVKVYDGTPITTYTLSLLYHSSVYQWYIVCKNDTCGTQGPVWNFTTMQNLLQWVWCDAFPNLDNWTIVGPLGTANWSANNSSSAGGTAPELRMSWTPSFNGTSKIRSTNIPLPNNRFINFAFNYYFDWYDNPSGTITVSVTYDGGTNSTPIFTHVDTSGEVGPLVVTGTFTTPGSGSQNAQFEISFNGNSFNNDNIYWDNFCINYYLTNYPPEPPSNLTAQVIFNPGPQVQLGWLDNSYDEDGFNVLRKNGQPNDPGDYVLIGTVGQNITQFNDAAVLAESTYTYRVFAYNPWGQNGSNTATIAVPVPVELISFTADVDNNVVTLFWQTATETNNSGFEIERLQDYKIEELQEWKRIGFVEGEGTTTEIQSYSFTDKPEPGKYKYRLKQIDYDGSFAYSPEIEAEVQTPTVFSLEQNYPNPFNPATKIKYTIPTVETRHASSLPMVTLIIYDILGNEVATLVNEEQESGVYEVEFNATNLPSGIYFYQLKAGSFIETKKMILLK